MVQQEGGVVGQDVGMIQGSILSIACENDPLPFLFFTIFIFDNFGSELYN